MKTKHQMNDSVALVKFISGSTFLFEEHEYVGIAYNRLTNVMTLIRTDLRGEPLDVKLSDLERGHYDEFLRNHKL